MDRDALLSVDNIKSLDFKNGKQIMSWKIGIQ